jgi:hypothetical protein
LNAYVVHALRFWLRFLDRGDEGCTGRAAETLARLSLLAAVSDYFRELDC